MFCDVIHSNDLMRWFGRGHGALLVVIAVAGWPGSWVFCLRWSGCCRVVCIGGAVVGEGVAGVGGIAAVAADVAVLWWDGLWYVPFETKSGGRLVKWSAGHDIVGCS